MSRALVIDDHPIVFQGCRRLLGEVGVSEIIERRSPPQGYRSFLRDKPDLVVTDLAFTDDDLEGLALIERIMGVDPTATIMVFTMHDDVSIVARSLALGAKGYALKDSASHDLTAAFRTVLQGDVHIDQQLAIGIAEAFGQSRDTNGLSPRETQVLRLLGRGFATKAIAERMGISDKTVINATAVMRRKLDLATYADLLRYSIEHYSA